MTKQYGIANQNSVNSDLERCAEEIRCNGYAVLKGVLSKEKCEYYAKQLVQVYNAQVDEFGREALQRINELNLARMPFAYDASFLQLVEQPQVLELVRHFLGEFATLHLQNGVINVPNNEHHQTSWHRDLPYQNYTLSSPIAINAFYCLTPFNSHTGGTCLLPNSHGYESLPSNDFLDAHLLQPDLDPGDVLFFDSWIFHKAGKNESSENRIGINQVYTTPIIKQQINIPALINEEELSEELKKVLGYPFQLADSVHEYRKKRYER